MPTSTRQPVTPHADEQARAIAQRLRERNPKADPLGVIPDVHPARIPRHVAIIMDGNGRWATARGLGRSAGHVQGAVTVKTILDEVSRLGIEYVTLYSFSLENWKRPPDEVEALMALYIAQMDAQRQQLMDDHVRFVQIGRRAGLPQGVLDKADELMELTRNNTAATVCLAVNYGSRGEITDAMRDIARRVRAGTLDPESIDESTIERSLYTAGIPDPDLLIRTAGELRVSNYLLWQISYSELHVTDVLWPDFAPADLHRAVRDYASRTRKFGGLG